MNMLDEKLTQTDLDQLEIWFTYILTTGSKRSRMLKELLRLARLGMTYDENREAIREYLREWKKRHPDAELPGVIG